MKHVSNMSVRQKVGQSMLIGFTGTELTPEVTELIQEDMVGGVILFARNFESPGQVLKLTQDLQSAARQSNHPHPLLVTIDQENGIVRRLKKGVTNLPGNMLLGAVDDVESTQKVSRVTAEELNALGVNMNLAPVLDVNNNPQNPVIGVRSFGEDASHVAKHGAAFIQGHQDAGVMTTAKHFPGHGDTAVDSHADLPVISHSMERLKEIELSPFAEAIRGGVDSIMMSHIHFSTIDGNEGIPASLSRKVTTGLLREKLGYDGVIMTDSLEMNGVVKKTGTVEGALAALKAGSDLLMVSHTYDLQVHVLDRIEKAVKDEEIEENMLDHAVNRIMRLKTAYLSWEKTPTYRAAVPSSVGGQEHETIAREQYERGVTLVTNENILPLKLDPSGKLLVVTIKGQAHSPIEGERRDIPYLAKMIHRFHSNILQCEISKSPSEEEIDRILADAEAVDQVVFGADNAYSNERQTLLIRKLLKKQPSMIVVSIGNPYDIVCFPEIQAYLAAYEYSMGALEAAVDIIFGQTQAKGKLPVSIPWND